MKGVCTILRRKVTIYSVALLCCLLAIGVLFWPGAGGQQIQEQEFEENEVGSVGVSSQAEKQEYKQERARIKALRKSFKPGPVNDLEEYEKFADEIQKRWQNRKKEYYARLMLEVCGPLSSGNFKHDRRYELARKYALLAVAEPNEISFETELNLIGHAITLMIGRNAPKGEKWAQLRKKDVEIRLHAWKRLMDAIDPNWDPNDVPFLNISATGIRPGIVPKDPDLRAEYDAAIEKMREIEKDTQKREWNSKQYRLRKLQKRFAPTAERYIVRAYSKPPFNLEELKQYLGKYAVDKKTRARILDAVKKNMEKQIQKMKMLKEPTMQ